MLAEVETIDDYLRVLEHINVNTARLADVANSLTKLWGYLGQRVVGLARCLGNANLSLSISVPLSRYVLKRVASELQPPIPNANIEQIPLYVSPLVRRDGEGAVGEDDIVALFFRYAVRDDAYLRIPADELQQRVIGFSHAMNRLKKFLVPAKQNVYEPNEYENLLVTRNITYQKKWDLMQEDLRERFDKERKQLERDRFTVQSMEKERAGLIELVEAGVKVAPLPDQFTNRNKRIREYRRMITQCRLMARYERQTGIKLEYLLELKPELNAALGLHQASSKFIREQLHE
jgi:hypothetical protein